jgi:hypothetical protein
MWLQTSYKAREPSQPVSLRKNKQNVILAALTPPTFKWLPARTKGNIDINVTSSQASANHSVSSHANPGLAFVRRLSRVFEVHLYVIP